MRTIYKFTAILFIILLSTVSAYTNPQNIVSLSPSITEIIYYVGAGTQLVGVTTYCNYPDEVMNLPKVGGYYGKTISMEAIVSLSPDLVICEDKAHGMLSSQFEKLGIKALYITNISLHTLEKNIMTIGEATGHSEIAKEKAAEIKESLIRLQRICESFSSPNVYWEIWDDPIISAGPDSFIDEGLNYLHCINIFSDAKSEWPQVDDEIIILRNPDVVVISNTRRGLISKDSIRKRPGWMNITAVRNDRIYFVDEDIYSRPGPRLIAGMYELAKSLYPSWKWEDE